MVNASLPQGRLPSAQTQKRAIVSPSWTNYMTSNRRLPRRQSGYRKDHSTETAVPKVCSDALVASAERQVTLLLLDLSTTFDCVDHGLVIRRLEPGFGGQGARVDLVVLGGHITAAFIQYRAVTSLSMVSFGIPQEADEARGRVY